MKKHIIVNTAEVPESFEKVSDVEILNVGATRVADGFN